MGRVHCLRRGSNQTTKERTVAGSASRWPGDRNGLAGAELWRGGLTQALSRASRWRWGLQERGCRRGKLFALRGSVRLKILKFTKAPRNRLSFGEQRYLRHGAPTAQEEAFRTELARPPDLSGVAALTRPTAELTRCCSCRTRCRGVASIIGCLKRLWQRRPTARRQITASTKSPPPTVLCRQCRLSPAPSQPRVTRPEPKSCGAAHTPRNADYCAWESAGSHHRLLQI